MEYNSGNKESLAKLIADSIKKFAKENNGKEEVGTDWILNGEKIANSQGEEVLIGQTGKSGCYMGKMTIEFE